MKNILLLSLFFFVEILSAQTNSVVGKWEVVAVNNGEVFYNTKTDSISIISEDLKEMYDDESKIKTLKEMMKKLYTNNRLEFGKDGVFKMETDLGGTIEMKYKNDTKRNLIISELNHIPTDEMPYKFIGGQFHFAMTQEMSFILERIK